MSEQFAAQLAATEVILLALLERHGRDPAFWERVDNIASLFTGLHSHHPSTGIPQMADAAQNLLDEWREKSWPGSGRQAAS